MPTKNTNKKQDSTLQDIQARHSSDDANKWAAEYDKPKNPIYKNNKIWDNDLLRSGIERYFLLKNELMREIMESYGEYVGETDYGKNVKIRFKSAIEGDDADWNADFTGAFIKNFGGMALSGDFPIPAPVISYMKQVNAAVGIPASKIGHGDMKAQYTEAMRRVRAFTALGLPEYTALALAGITFTEDTWRPSGAVNMQERSGGGQRGTGGVNAGEGMIGLTYAAMKIRCITKAGMWGKPGMGSPSNFAATYNFGISKLGCEDMARVVLAYASLSGKWGAALLGIKNPVSETDRTVICCAAYKFKAGDSGWPGDSARPADYISAADRSASVYRRHNGYEGFTNGVIMAYLLAAVIRADKSGDADWGKVTRAALAEIEAQIGKLK